MHAVLLPEFCRRSIAILFLSTSGCQACAAVELIFGFVF